MINWFKKKKVAPIYVTPGDSICLTYNDANGRTEKVTYQVDKFATYNTMAVGELNDELGFSEGLVAVIGHEK